MKKDNISLVVGLIFAGLVTGCTVNPYSGEKQVGKVAYGAGIGAASGALIGMLTGDDSRERRNHALIGAGVGALAGGGAGYYMDVQETKLRQRLQVSGVSVTRVGDEIVLNMPGNITFDSGSASVKSNFYEVLNSVSLVLNEYPKSLVDVFGHTDSTGSAQMNQQLSENRAASVGQYFITQGVMRKRIATKGFGENHPVTTNDTSAGRSTNRRVEIRISPLTST
ncbi:MAG: OmpA family protein [Magnetococcales bacterium]|nr:OmpA family protein [Magnetococcales bacterium]